MNDNPIQIVDDLIGQHGVDGALETVRDGIAAAKANGDNYRLRVRTHKQGFQISVDLIQAPQQWEFSNVGAVLVDGGTIRAT
jgi:hypothetical protein